MRVKIRVSSVLGSLEPNWAESCTPPGIGSVPDVGTSVWVEFEGGDPSYPVWMGIVRVANTSGESEE